MNDFQERLYLIFTGIFIASLVACNLIFQKFFTWNFLGLTFELSVGIIAYPITFLVTDLISELYGKKRANQVVISGFCASIFTTLLIFISMTAQFIDVRIFHFWKRLTKGKHLWLRNNASTMFSQLVDTSMVLLILCSAGAIGWERFGSLLLMGWLFKVIVAAVDTPIIYFLLWVLKDKIRPASYLEEK